MAASQSSTNRSSRRPQWLAVAASTSRRWQNFRANRRGYWSLWLFLVLFGLSLVAEFIANDKPIIASYKGEILFPVADRLSGGKVRRLPGRNRLPLRLSSATRSTPMAG